MTKPVQRGVRYKIDSAVGTIKEVVKGAVTSGEVLADSTQTAQRLSVCSTCSEFTGTTCNLCGCLMKFKAKLLYSKCPIAKW